MLVLSRRTGDSIVIDGQIRVTVLDVRGRTIRLGIEAPRNVEIQREEILGEGRAEAVTERRSA